MARAANPIRRKLLVCFPAPANNSRCRPCNGYRDFSSSASSNRFKPEKPQYSNSISIGMPEPTAYTPALVKYALHLLKRIYRPGYDYKKAGVTLMDIVPATESQLNLFVRFEHSKHDDLMKAMDRINAQWGRDTLRSGAAGIARPWGMKRARLSGRFTTEWGEMLRVKL